MQRIIASPHFRPFLSTHRPSWHAAASVGVRVGNRGYRSTPMGSNGSPIISERVKRPSQDDVLLIQNESDFTISSLDFPFGFVDGNHPSDFVLLPEPLKPEWIWINSPDLERMWFRISFKVPGGFMPATFLVGTGAPSWLWHNDRLYKHLLNHGRLPDGGLHLGTDFGLDGVSFPAYFTPQNHKPANVIGVKLIDHLGLVVKQRGQWRWIKDLPYF